MARQMQTPVQFGKTTRMDNSVVMTSGDPGVVTPVTYIPLLRGDSMSGRVGIDIELAEMPRPLLNAVIANVQAWYVPKTAHPQFTGYDEFMAAYQGEPIKALGETDRDPPQFFLKFPNGVAVHNTPFYKTLGLHNVQASQNQSTDLVDAFNLIYNFRLAAHSSKMERRKYATEDWQEATALPRAFWPSGRFSRVVPDYEQALVVGSLNLDVVAGRMPVSGLGIRAGSQFSANSESINETGGSAPVTHAGIQGMNTTPPTFMAEDPDNIGFPGIFAEMEGQAIGITLADIDKARETQAFARLRSAYAGNDATGFDNDDAIVAELMQGFSVPSDLFKRPWLLDQQQVTFGMVERHATDGANLDASVTQGRASATLSLNVPANDSGGVVIVTVEVLPERLDERQSDEWGFITDTAQLPNALRDVQRPEPVDLVINRRLDARHTSQAGLYGYEPMNDVWNRSFTRLGGSFYQDDPANPWTEQRSAIWQSSVVDPEYTEDHWLAPDDFPKYVFSDATAPAFEMVARHTATIVGLTQIGDVLVEDNNDYENVLPE